jgi:hypothetical protein
VSEINLALYRMFAQPMVRAMVSEPAAEWLRRLHPLRLQYELLSDKNPWLAPVTAMAAREPSAGGGGQSIPGGAGDCFRADRRRPQFLAGWG